jgi:hypothetical protein
MLGITDDYVAYCLDQAVGYFGRHLEAELEKAGSDAKNDDEAQWKRQLLLDRYLGEEEDKPQRGRFADPSAMLK